MDKNKVLITGVAGFIGFHLAKFLVDQGISVIGIDNLNSYYDQNLKLDRISILNKTSDSSFSFIKMDISDKDKVLDLFKNNNFDNVIHLAAQAGVRYSIDNPFTYLDSNFVGFLSILEACRTYKPNHLIFASSSSVYGMNSKIPFSPSDNTDFPVSLYAASKKSNEVVAHSYSHLYDIPITGLRFFTVYGTFGRPDMAYYKFTESILSNKPIKVFNNGLMKRDFTHIEDIVQGIFLLIDRIPDDLSLTNTNSKAKYSIYNIGNNNPIKLNTFIELIEDACNKKAIKEYLPMQPGDVPETYADITDLNELINFSPKIKFSEGITDFVYWYKNYIN